MPLHQHCIHVPYPRSGVPELFPRLFYRQVVDAIGSSSLKRSLECYCSLNNWYSCGLIKTILNEFQNTLYEIIGNLSFTGIKQSLQNQWYYNLLIWLWFVNSVKRFEQRLQNIFIYMATTTDSSPYLCITHRSARQ